MDANTVPVSMVMTVRNEEESIRHLLDSVLAQTVRPAEVVIVDGGSCDNTVSVARSYEDRLPVRLIEKPGANISEGRNLAVRSASYNVIAATDAGVRLDPRWLGEITAPLLDEASELDVVSGFFAADPHSPFERAMGATVLPATGDIQAEKFLPSSRSVAFRREAWEAAGGYPEWLDYCEDLVFDLAMREAGCRFLFRPSALAHFRPRPNLRSFFVQYYRYARGDGKADLWRLRHAIRYSTYTAGPAIGAWGWAHRHRFAGKVAQALVAAGAAAYCRRPYARLLPMLKGLPPASALRSLAFVPAIRFVGDAAKMVGYPVGVAWRLRHRRDR